MLIRLEFGEITEAELLARQGITAVELAQWRKDYPLNKALSPYSAHKRSRFGNFFLILAVLDVVVMYGLYQYAGQTLKDRLSMPVAMVLCVAVLGLIYQDVERGVVKAGRKRMIRRDENPVGFWLVITAQGLVMLAFAGAILVVAYRG